MNRLYLCEWRSRLADGQTEYYPSLLDLLSLSFSAIDLRTNYDDSSAALVKIKTDDAQHALLIADPSVEYLWDV